MTLLDGQHIRQSLPVAYHSDSAMLAALQTTVGTVVRTKDIVRLDTDRFPIFSVGWTWQGFCRDLDPCWFE